MESRKTPERVFRIGRKPDPWQAPDWSRANSDGTFGNRFDDPKSHYRVLYAASQKLSCFLETLARFRPDLTLLAELGEIIGADDFLPLGIVPYEWCESRMLGAASTDGEYADIYAAGWIVLLRTNLADECIRLGLGELDAVVLQNAPRRITQRASLLIYERGFSGVYYRSRYRSDLENWALFEPFRIAPHTNEFISPEDPTLQEALALFHLQLG